MTQLKAYRVAINILGGSAFVREAQRGSGFEICYHPANSALPIVYSKGSTRRDAIRRAINKKFGVRL